MTVHPLVAVAAVTAWAVVRLTPIILTQSGLAPHTPKEVA